MEKTGTAVSTTPIAVGDPVLNAGLSVLILPISGDLPSSMRLVSDPYFEVDLSVQHPSLSPEMEADSDALIEVISAHGDEDVDYFGIYPFLPDRLGQSTASMLGGTLRLAATAEHGVMTQDVGNLRFGRSKGTLKDSPEESIWQGKPSVCVSLWSTGTGLAVTIERIHHLTEDQSRTEQPKEPFLGKVGIEHTLNRLLAGTHLTAHSDLSSLLRGTDLDDETTQGTLFRNADELGDLGVQSIVDLYIEGPDVARGHRMAEGLIVDIEPDASAKVHRLLEGEKSQSLSDEDEFDNVARTQSGTLPWDWSSMPLVTEPAEDGAEIAIRGDCRSVLLNLEAMSIYHDYAGMGGEHVVIACIPYVIAQARSAADCRAIAAMIDGLSGDRDVQVEDHLEMLVEARRTVEEAQRRQVLWAYDQKFNHLEKFSTWTHGGNLAAILSVRNKDRAQGIAAEVEKMSKMIGRSIEQRIQRSTIEIQKAEKELQRSAEERDSRHPLRVLIESVALGAAALSLFVGLVMTTAAAPALEGSGTVGIWPAVLISGATLLVGTFFGRFLRRFR